MDETNQKRNTFIREWTFYLLSKWKFIALITFIFGFIGLGLALKRNTTYKGELTFVLSNEDNNDLSSLTNQFGINLGSNNDAFAGDNIVNLFKSRKMVQWALFQKTPGQNLRLLDIYLTENEMDKNFRKDKRLQHVIPFPNDTAALTLQQDSILRQICGDIASKNLTITRPDTKLSFFTISTLSENEIFSCYFTRYLVEATSKLYIDTKTTSARKNLLMLQAEADSVNRLINNAVTATNSAVDQVFNLNPSLQVQRAPVFKNQFKATVNEAAYTEILKNLELAKISLQKQSPIYLVLDEPNLPLERIEFSKLIAIVVGLFTGILLGIVYFVAKRILIRVFDQANV